MDILKEIAEDSLVLCDTNLKQELLEKRNNQGSLINFKLMTFKEFLEQYFFSYNEETIYYVTKKYNVTIKNAKLYLEEIKYILNSSLSLKKISFLKQLYRELKDKNLIKENNYFKEYLKNKTIIVFEKEKLDKFTLSLLESYKVKYLDINNKKRDNNIIYHFNSIEEEVEFVFNEISKLLKSNISLENIKVIPLGNEYNSFLKRFSFLYQIPFQNIDKVSIISSIYAKKILDKVKNSSKKEVYEYIISLDNYQKDLLNLINKYYFIDDLNMVYEEIKDGLKEILINDNNEGIEVVQLNSYIKESDYVFVLGFNLENIPKTYKDIDYFNDIEKEKLGLFTSFSKNKLEHDLVVKYLNKIKNITISYKDRDPYNSYFKSNLIEELGLVENYVKNINITSNIYNKIKLTSYLDTMLKYGILDKNIQVLYSTYQDIPYLTYSNKYKKIKRENSNITMSYTSLNNYYHCAFRYYIDSILRLSPFEETFNLKIGTIFHYVLSKIYEDDFDFEKEFTKAIKDKSFTPKEEFYLLFLKDELIKIIEVLKYQYKLTGLTKVKLEEEIDLKYHDNENFIGVIDKIMYKEKDNNTYLAVIDYKTGTPKINMTNLKYGLDMQLPIYLYLIKKSNLFLNPKIIGFYLEQILFEKGSKDSKKDEDEKRKDNLKLNGYSIDDPYLVSMFDETYQDSEMIKGMKITSKGFSHYTKVISEDAILELINIVDSKIKEAFKKIHENDFTINPKVINGENLGCSFCKYKDLCFKTGEDLVYLKEEKDLSYLEN